MYEYTAECDEELTFPEGAYIELVRRSVDGVDDGWWEGRFEGKTGVFPSVVVEVINEVCIDDVMLIHCTSGRVL